MLGRFSSALDSLLALQEAFDAASDFDFFGGSTTSRGTSPSVNIFKDNDDIVLMAELPGMKKEDIAIEIKDNMITLGGKRETNYPENASVHRLERRAHRFSRSMRLPTKVDADKVRAEYKNGILAVVLPRAESDKPKLININ